MLKLHKNAVATNADNQAGNGAIELSCISATQPAHSGGMPRSATSACRSIGIRCQYSLTTARDAPGFRHTPRHDPTQASK
ncbi:MAG TPA: hypothetical protein VME45_07125, partial [Stellaceae bacterium]|nr:hypothetical protein [Stellaceae bacterium]